MAVRNQKTNKYEAYKFIKRYSKLITGYGKTKEIANADLKKKVEEFFMDPLEPTDSPIHSPGIVFWEDENTGKKHRKYMKDRKAPVYRAK